jgi:hypothetical protein
MAALFERQIYFDALLTRNIDSGFITFLSCLEAVNISVPVRNFGL